MGTRTLDRIWRSEAAYFDGEADAALRSRWPSDEVLIARYAKSSQVWFNKEYRFSRLGDLRGKRVLDVGCGLGDNTVFLAARGADVTGVDLSEKSIAVARERVARLELPLQPRFVCAPLETADLPLESFDVIWGDGFLHHVLHDLEGALDRLVAFARDGALFVFSEPVDRVPGMRRLRLWLPISVEGTPDERPLKDAELDVVKRFLPEVSVRAFSFLGRLCRLFPPGAYETAPVSRRAITQALCLADFGLLAVPGLSRLGGMAVLTAKVRKSSPRR